MTQLDLACYAFGQNCNVTPVALIAAQAACINGGYLHTPYLVDQITGQRRQRHLSARQHRHCGRSSASRPPPRCASAWSMSSPSARGKNGQVTGYRIGGKTGTADKGNTGDVVVSFLCFAPADDPQIIMLITMDTPSRTTGTYVSGGNMVAPTSSKVMSEILPYLGIEPVVFGLGAAGHADTTVPNVTGMDLADAKAKLEARGFGYKIVGDGDTVTDQTPVGGAVIPGKSVVILYAGAEKSTEPVYRSAARRQESVRGERRRDERGAAHPLLRRDGQRLRERARAAPVARGGQQG